MKQLLLVLLLLGVSMPASADVHVYTMKASNAEYKYNSDSNALGQIKDANRVCYLRAARRRFSQRLGRLYV